MAKFITPLFLFALSNTFMTFAWYTHLKELGAKPLWMAILFSWGIAFLEYGFLVPGIRMAFVSGAYSLQQIRVLQEVISLTVFVPIAIFIFRQPVTLNFLWAGLCIAGAIYFIFR